MPRKQIERTVSVNVQNGSEALKRNKSMVYVKDAKPRGLAIDTNDVPLVFAPNKPTQIWWTGAQWCVTSIGLERRDGTYPIWAEALSGLDEEGRSWLHVMANHEDADLADFATAYWVAIAMHGAELTARERRAIRGHYHLAVKAQARADGVEI
jgi:hypothetical protein